MASSAARTAGKIYKEVEIAGQKIALTEPEKVGMVGEMAAFIMSRRLDATIFAIRACKAAPASMHAAIWTGATAVATRGDPTPEEWDAFDRSLWNTAFRLYKTMAPHHFEGLRTIGEKVDFAMSLIEQDAGDQDELVALIRLVSQDGDLKNLSGRTATSANPAIQATDIPSSTDGQPSISTSPTDSAGPEMR